jgi:uncharacterized protein YukE
MNLQANLGNMNYEAKEIHDAAVEYNNAVEDLYKIVDNLSSSWQGTDNITFANKINDYKEEIIALGNVVNNYAIFLNKSSGSLDELQGDISSAAGKL